MTAVPIVLQCGADYWIQFVATDGSGAPVTVTNPRMDVRPEANSGSVTIYTSQGVSPSILITQPSSNIVVASIPSAATKNVIVGRDGSWDAYGTDPSGKTILLGSGSFRSLPNVTGL